mmetsp:Transcript_19880/g.31107  ORF Transcript_19880/g.31107 Transcript_19880/m.31107 type:complete len:166 (+) Transcript_19880:61-558(+)
MLQVWEQRYSSCRHENKRKKLAKQKGEEVPAAHSGPRREEDGGTRKPGESWPGWKELGWDDLDQIDLKSGVLVLKHNANAVFEHTVNAGESIATHLQALSKKAKSTPGANPKITGFIKVVACTQFNNEPLPRLLQNAGLMRKYPSSWSSYVVQKGVKKKKHGDRK